MSTVYTPTATPYFLQPQKRTRRGHPTRPRRNPRMDPRPPETWRPGER